MSVTYVCLVNGAVGRDSGGPNNILRFLHLVCLVNSKNSRLCLFLLLSQPFIFSS